MRSRPTASGSGALRQRCIGTYFKCPAQVSDAEPMALIPQASVGDSTLPVRRLRGVAFTIGERRFGGITQSFEANAYSALVV